MKIKMFLNVLHYSGFNLDLNNFVIFTRDLSTGNRKSAINFNHKTLIKFLYTETFIQLGTMVIIVDCLTQWVFILGIKNNNILYWSNINWKYIGSKAVIKTVEQYYC